jgi:hypothetical protein
MKQLGLIAAVTVLFVPASTNAAACSPLDCAPSQFLIANGSLLATRGSAQSPIRVIDLRTGRTRLRLPAGIVSGETLVSRRGATLEWRDLVDGARLGTAQLHVNGVYALTGLSQDGTEAVLTRTTLGTTTFAIVSPEREHFVELRGGNWGFDALRDSNLVLVRYMRFGYQVRLYNLTSRALDRRPLKDPGESALISGVPLARASSAGGRYVFTLYAGPNGNAMIHELDLEKATAHCIDLPGGGDFGAALTYGLAVAGNTLWAVSPGYGRVVGIDVARQRVREVFDFKATAWTQNSGMAALSPDRSRIAVTDAQHVWLVDLSRRNVRLVGPHVAIALAFSTDGNRLWGIGERSRVFSLRAHG